MGRADNAHIDLERFIVTDTAYFAALQNAKQFGLHGFGEFADFIKEQGASICDFKKSNPVLIGPGKSAFAMTKKFTFDQ